jgi:hypothetical protein
MEIAVIGSLIVSGLAIVALGVINVFMVIRNSNDRTQLEKLIKARDLREYELYRPQEPEEEVEESIEERYIPLEEMTIEKIKKD